MESYFLELALDSPICMLVWEVNGKVIEKRVFPLTDDMVGWLTRPVDWWFPLPEANEEQAVQSGGVA